MPLQRHATDFENLTPETLAAWREIPPAIVSDCMNRTHSMAAAIKPLKPGTVLAGQARTVTSMVGDNGISLPWRSSIGARSWSSTPEGTRTSPFGAPS